MIVLGIETSCDETSAAVVRDGDEVLSSVVASQADLHARWGGVVPEAASRKHVERLLPVVEEALGHAGLPESDVDGIAVTNRPGLVGALVAGVACAKALAYAWQKPIVGVHHVLGHVYASRLADRRLEFPFVCLVVSGGHTELVLAESHDRVWTMGRTRDDAAGECFDKCARLMGLPYPGGPHIERLAAAGDARAVSFPRAWLGDSLDFSFSGLKTAVARFVKLRPEDCRLEDIAASLQAAIVDVLVAKAIHAAQVAGVRRLAIGGGVAANRAFANAVQRAASEAGLSCVTPSIELCTDNAAMIAAAGHPRIVAGNVDDMSLDCMATDYLPLWPGCGSVS
jgi:N6-L-threonylcarbamoyladenine synthase